MSYKSLVSTDQLYRGETGSFTPTIEGSTTPGVGTYSRQEGYYMCYGSLVIISYEIVWSAHTGTGNLELGNLPFTIDTYKSNGPVVLQNINWTNATYVLLEPEPGTVNARFVQTEDNTPASFVSIDSAGEVRGNIYYKR